MPPKSSEVMHKHRKSQQFFYVLSGTALFQMDGEQFKLEANEGIHIRPGVVHCITNPTDKALEILVISEPHSHTDRTDI